MRRRSLLLAAGAAGAAAASGVGFWRWQEIPSTVRYPGRSLGHALRDSRSSDWPDAGNEYATDVAIVGSGIAGLTAAWRLAREGHRRFILLAGPERHGNAASGRASVGGEGLRYPTGAHYLPLPSMESTHVRSMLVDFGVLLDGAETATPTYDERIVVHAPDERLYRDGRWQEGLVPYAADAASDGSRRRAAQGSETERFLLHVDALKETRGADGRKVFAVPIALASADPAWASLDALTFASWLDRERYVDPALRWYLDYCCRDDYGAPATRVSAWAGLHYFAARNGRASNADPGAVLTWPEGLDAMAEALDGAVPWGPEGPATLAGQAVSIRDRRGGVEILCAAPANGGWQRFRIHARRVVSAMPLAVAKHVVAPLRADGYDPAAHAPRVVPWLVANVLLSRHPEEADGAPLAWDNVLYGSDGLGYVDATHQAIRVARPEPTVFTTYRSFGDGDVDAARRWMDRASAAELGALAVDELRRVYGWRLAPCVERVDVTLRGHAMASPAPGTLANRGLRALRDADGAVLYAHADLSGYSVFEEAAWWGWQAAGRILE